MDKFLIYLNTGKYLLGHFQSILPLSSITSSKYIEYIDSDFTFEVSFMLLLTFSQQSTSVFYKQAERSLSSLAFISKCNFSCFIPICLKDISSLPSLLPLGPKLRIEQLNKDQDK